MLDFLKKNIFIIILSTITLFIGFLTFLTFIDRSFIELNQNNLQFLLIFNIILLFLLFAFIFVEIKKSIKNDIDKDGLNSNKKYITYFSLFTLIPSILISIFSLFLFSFALEKYFDKKVTTVVNNSYELAKTINFFGTHPRITQVPPNLYSSAIPTRLPNFEASLAALTPPDPAPMIKRSKSYFSKIYPLCSINLKLPSLFPIITEFAILMNNPVSTTPTTFFIFLSKIYGSVIFLRLKSRIKCFSSVTK